MENPSEILKYPSLETYRLNYYINQDNYYKDLVKLLLKLAKEFSDQLFENDKLLEKPNFDLESLEKLNSGPVWINDFFELRSKYYKTEFYYKDNYIHSYFQKLLKCLYNEEFVKYKDSIELSEHLERIKNIGSLWRIDFEFLAKKYIEENI